MGPSALELPILVLARVVPRALLSERLVARNELVRCNTDGDEAADDAQDHIFVRRTVASRGKEISILLLHFWAPTARRPTRPRLLNQQNRRCLCQIRLSHDAGRSTSAARLAVKAEVIEGEFVREHTLLANMCCPY